MRHSIRMVGTTLAAAGLATTLLLGGCAQSTSSGGTAAQEAAEAAPTQTVKFHGARLTMPEGWTEDNWTESMDGWQDCRFWHAADVSFGAGGVCGLTQTYEQFKNTDTQMPDPSDPVQQEIKAKLDAGFKALDAKSYLAQAVSAYGLEVDEADVAFDEVDGCALWSVEGKTESGYVYCCSIPLNKRFIMLVMATQGDALDSDQLAILDALKLPKKTDATILSQAKRMEGKTQDEVMDFLLKDAELPSQSTTSTGTSSGATGYRSDSGSSSSFDSDSSTKVTEIGGDTYLEDKDGNVTQLGENGSVTRYTDDGITTFNSDGTKEWTDGWGTVVRDTDGDGEPDIVSHDSGETWGPAN